MRRLLLALILLLVAAPAASAQAPPSFDGGRRVYDATGSSLMAAQTAGLERRLAALKQIGADGLVLVRAQDASPKQTLKQVERLQQNWVKETGADEDTAFAILVNRNPDDPNDARAGVFVGKTYRDGNVPEGEQRDIVDEALIPPLRKGDVAGSFAAGLERLRSDIVNGPPTSAFEDFSADATDSWLPWTLLGLALAGLGGALALFGRRARTDLPDEQPRTIRPGGLPLELGGALAHGSPTVLVMPAALLELAARDALAIEPESEGGRFSEPKVQVRLTDRSRVDGALEELVWARLSELADDDLVDSESLQKLTAEPDAVKELARDGLRERGWLEEGAGRPLAGLIVVTVLGLLLGTVGLVLVGVGGGGLLPVVAVVALMLVGFVALVMATTYPTLSTAGQEAALPWKAYKKGLAQAAKDESMTLDLDAVLPDAVALGLGGKLKDRLEAATERGVTLKAFRGAEGAEAYPASFPWWLAFSSSTSTTSSSSGGATVSGGGAGGGGGAAGST